MSFAAVPIILAKGGEFYKNYGIPAARAERWHSRSPATSNGAVWSRRLASTDATADRGLGRRHLQRPAGAHPVQIGGPLGAYLPESKFDVPMDYEEFAKVDAMVGAGGLVVFDDTVDMAKMARFAMEFCAIESCR